MKVIVGLGNVGRRYAATRHNAGFLVVEELAKRHAAQIAQPYRWMGAEVARFGDARIASPCGASSDQLVRLVLPQTMMNGSGEALRALREWDVAIEDALVVSDEAQLPLGSLRLRPKGSAGGHHGLESVLQVLQTDAVPRLRVGVGSATLPNDLIEFVLSPFAPGERPVIAQAIASAADACAWWATEGIEAAMNRVNASPV